MAAGHIFQATQATEVAALTAIRVLAWPIPSGSVIGCHNSPISPIPQDPLYIWLYNALYMALNPSQSIISIHFHSFAMFPMFGKSCLKILVDRCSTCFNRLGLAWQLIDVDRIYRATCFFSLWPRHATTMVPGPISPIQKLISLNFDEPTAIRQISLSISIV